MTFGSRPLVRRGARGLVGAMALWLALRCPICWTIGLAETIAFRVLAAHDGAKP